MRRRALGLVAGGGAAIVAACVIHTSPKPERDPRAVSPLGVRGSLQLPSGVSVDGELLTMSGTAYVVRTERRIVVVPFTSAPTAAFAGFPRVVGVPAELVHARLREASRFPFGMPDDAMRAMLDHLHQTQPDTVVAEPPRDSAASAAFVERTRVATARYRDPARAVEDGFKRVGVEFPAMGEHWVSLPRVLENRFSGAAPSVLIYVRVGDRRELAGVAYTALLGPGEPPPRSAAPTSAWHEHNGTVAEESLPLHHATRAVGARDADRDTADLRLAILHVWTRVPNPAGPFVTDNWTLPALRLGVDAGDLPSDALRGAALALDGDGYYEQTLRTALDLRPGDAAVAGVDSVVRAHRQRVRHALAASPSFGSVTPALAEALAGEWRQLWADLGRLFAQRAARLRELAGQM